MDEELELLLDDIAITTHPAEPGILKVDEEPGASREKRVVVSSDKCLVDGILDAEYVEHMRAKVLARKRARIAQEVEKYEDVQSMSPKSCLEDQTSRDVMVCKSKDDGIGADMENAMMKIFVDVHELSTICGKLAGQVEIERAKFVAAESSKLECRNELAKVKAELEKVRKEKERAEVENAAASRRAIMYMGWWIGAKQELSEAKEELASRREIEVVEVVGDDRMIVQVSDKSNVGVVANDSVSVAAVGQVEGEDGRKFDFDLNVIPEDCGEEQEELEEGEIVPYA